MGVQVGNLGATFNTASNRKISMASIQEAMKKLAESRAETARLLKKPEPQQSQQQPPLQHSLKNTIKAVQKRKKLLDDL